MFASRLVQIHGMKVDIAIFMQLYQASESPMNDDLVQRERFLQNHRISFFRFLQLHTPFLWFLQLHALVCLLYSSPLYFPIKFNCVVSFSCSQLDEVLRAEGKYMYFFFLNDSKKKGEKVKLIPCKFNSTFCNGYKCYSIRFFL